MSRGLSRRSGSGERGPSPARFTDLRPAGCDADQEPQLNVVQVSEALDPGSASQVGEPLLAYLYLRRDAGAHTRAVLDGHVRAFARREGYDLLGVLVASEGSSTTTAGHAAPGAVIGTSSDATMKKPGAGGSPVMDGLLSLRALVEQIEVTCARKVLVVGPARQALVLLHRMRGIQVLTLAYVRPLGLDREGDLR
jgi:hypothetical protein